MQITLVSSGDTVSDVLNQFATNFFLDWAEIDKKFSRWIVSDSLRERSIRELKEMTDFLADAFNVTDLTAPKRNSKISLADWIAEVMLSAREVAESSEISEAIAEQAVNSECPNCGFVHEPFQNTLCPDGEPKSQVVEVLEPEEKPVYIVSIIADGAFSEERVSHLPPYLIDRKGNLLKRFWHRSCDAGYSEITSKHLSSIAVDSGLVITLMADNLEISQARICGDPPPFVVDGGGAYKRDQVRRGLAVSYSQVISEYLPNIVVV